MPTPNGTSRDGLGVDPAFPHPAETAVESSPSASKWLDEDGQKMTYAELIHIAFRSTETKEMGLSELYRWFEQNTKRANERSERWKSSVRSNLSMNEVCQRLPSAM